MAWASSFNTAVSSPKPEMVAKYGELVADFDLAVEKRDIVSATAKHAELSDFVRRFDLGERATLERRAEVGGWTRERRQRLKVRWDALTLHRGSWSGWCAVLGEDGCGGGSSSSRTGGSQPAQDSLRAAARDLVFKLEPGENRRAFWLFCAGHLTVQVASDGVASLADEDQVQLEQMRLDADRTPNLSPSQRQVLLRVLSTYCRQRRLAGGQASYYLQGMHLLAACPLWAGLTEEEAVVILGYTIDMVCAGYYADSDFETFKTDSRVFEILISERLPHLEAALRDSGVPTMLLAFDPLLCLFAHNAPGPVAVRFWDVLLLEGNIAIFAVLLALLEQLLLPEAIRRDESSQHVDGEASSFAESPSLAELLRDKTAKLDPSARESIILRSQEILLGDEEEASSPPAKVGLRRRVEELRAQVANEAAKIPEASSRAGACGQM